MLNRCLVSLAIVLLLTATAHASTSVQIATEGANSNRVLKIGFVTTLSGSSGSLGRQMVNGIQLYLNQVQHRMAGIEVKLIVEDDGGNAAQAITELKKLIEKDKVDLVDGVLMSNIGLAVAQTCEKFQVPTLLAVCGADDVTKRQHLKWLIRTGASSSQCSQPLGQWAYQHLNYKKVATLAMDYEYGYEVVGGFQKTFEDAGGEIVQKVWVPMGVDNFIPWIRKIPKDCDGIFLVAVGKGTPNLIKQIRRQGIQCPIIAGSSTFDETCLDETGDSAVGGMCATVYSATLNTAANARFLSAYRTAYHAEPSFAAEGSYTSAMWINKAMSNVKDHFVDKRLLLSALRQVTLTDAPRGSLKLDHQCNPVQNVYLCRVEKVDGKLQNSVIATIPGVSQFWKYDPEQYLRQPPYSRNYPPCKFCPSH